jgi:hypothetical protein
MVSIFVFSLALLVQMVLGANLFNQCLNDSGNFTSNSTYVKNLNKLLKDLKSKSPATGFHTGSVGQSPDQVFGLAQCRGDISEGECQACINEATHDSHNLCPNAKAAMLWYDTCFLRYSQVEFTGTVASGSGAFLPNFPNASHAFAQSAISLLSNLSQEASVASKLFAPGETNPKNSDEIFGLVDCTRDLSSFLCKFCIDALVNALRDDKNVIGTRLGGRIITASCTIRYETFSFFNATRID